MHCGDMKEGDIYICQGCGLELEVIKQCQDEKCADADCAMCCCDTKMTKKQS